jgi:hypothetical protein
VAAQQRVAAERAAIAYLGVMARVRSALETIVIAYARVDARDHGSMNRNTFAKGIVVADAHAARFVLGGPIRQTLESMMQPGPTRTRPSITLKAPMLTSSASSVSGEMSAVG